MIQILQAGLLYFVLVFGAGFVLAPIRILWAAPAFGTRVAELIEMPIMFVSHHFRGALDGSTSRGATNPV